MSKRVIAIGTVACVALMGGVWAVNASSPGEEPTPEDIIHGLTGDGAAESFFDETTSVEVARDAYTVTERDAAGVMRATVSQLPLSVLREGTWVPVSTELTDLPGGGLTAADHPLLPVFAATADAPALLQVENGDHSLALSVEGADGVGPSEADALTSVPGSSALVYEGAMDGADLRFDVSSQAIHETVVVADAPESAVEYAWRIDAPGLHLEQRESGVMVFLDDSGAEAFAIPGPVMWDSSGGDGGMADSASTPVEYSIAEAGDGVWRLTLRPDAGWLADPERVYPVSIDPDVIVAIGAAATYKEDNWSYNYGSVPRIGNTKQTSTCCTWRTFIQFPLSPYFGKRVIGATVFSAQTTYGETATQAASLWWASSFGYAGNSTKIDDFTIGVWGGSFDPPIFDVVAHYLNNSDSGSYMMLVGEENDAVYSRKDLNLYLSFTYVDPATVTGVTGATPVSPAQGPLTKTYVDDLVMEATGVNNTPGTSQLFRYNFTSANGGVAWNSGWVAAGPFRLPDTALTPGKDYSYTIDTIDTGSASPMKSKGLATWKFHTASAPGEVTGVTVDGNALVGEVTTTAQRPVVSATVTSAESGPVWAIFTVRRDLVVVMDGVVGSSTTVTAGGTGVSSATLPYALAAGGTYAIEVQAFDGHMAGPSITAPGSLKGPPRTIREIPGADDSQIGATS